MSGIFMPKAKNQAANTPTYNGLQLQTSNYGRVVPVIFGTNRVAANLLWYGDFIATSHQSDAGGGGGKGGVGGGGGGKGGGGSVTYTYSTAVAMALCEGPILGIANVYVDKNLTSLSSQGFSFFSGAYPQSPWSYLTSRHPGEDLAYPGISYVAASSLQLGNSANLPNHNFEVQGFLSSSISGQVDADPSQVIAAILTDPHYGIGLASGKIGSLALYQSYAVASGLWVSPAYTDATSCAQTLQDLATATNSEFVWSSGQLTLVPYGDQAITANGFTYTPPSSPLFDLTDDDFIGDASADPVQMVRKRPADCYNSLQLEFTDRANFYNKGIAEVKDQAAIDQYGLVPMGNVSAPMFCDANAAAISAQLQLQRQSVRNTYTFSTDIRYIVLDPMDIVSITDEGLGLFAQWVRIIDIELNEDDTLTFTVEEYLAGTGSPALFSIQVNDGYNVDYNSPPGPVNDPVIFEAPVQIATTGLETWMAVSGGTNWGGADVYLSSDGNTYKLAGRIVGPSRQGVLSANLASGTDPDTVHTLSVDLSESRASLISGTKDDADQLHTLCFVDGELIAFQTATLTGTNAYDLTYLRRGAYGTTIAAHAIGSLFARLDDGIFKYSYDKSLIGQTVYVKFCSYNIFGGAVESLADVTAIEHVVMGPPNPPNVMGFGGQQNGNVVSFHWDHVIDFALKGYDVGYARIGENNWDNFEILSEVAAGTEMTNASVPPGTWTFGIRARDIADQLSPVQATFDMVVMNENNSVLKEDQDPNWPGVSSGFYLHWTGVLVPVGTHPASFYTGWDVFDKFVPDPVSEAVYTTPDYDNGFDDLLRVWSAVSAVLGPGETGTPNVSTSLDSWLTGQTDPGIYVPWVLGYQTLRYGNMKLSYTGITEGNVAFISTFNLDMDRGTNVELVDTVTVAPGGTPFTFPQPFHFDPLVTVNYTGTSGYYANASMITPTDCVLNVWNAGVSVGGTVSLKAEGV